jgi:polyhydroxyalkanoate synthesis regulator phasin
MMDKKLEQLFYAVLGGALTVKERIEASNEELKAWQEKSEANARTLFDDLAQRGEKEKVHLKEMFKEILKQVVDELDLATKQDLEKLKRKLEK